MKNKLAPILLSILAAVGLWLYVVTFVSPNSDKHYYNIPVTVQGEVILQERGLMITANETPTVSLHLEGNRTDLNKLNSSNITVTVDLSKIGEAGEHSLVFTPTYPGDVPNNAITVLSKDPGTVTVHVEERLSKTVPVEIRYQGSLAEGYMADKENKTLNYEQVNISGPKPVVDKIAMARIDVDMENRTESVSGQFQYTLCNEKGEPVDAKFVTTDVEAVSLTLRIVRVKEITLVVNVIDGGGATEDTSTIEISPSTIRVSGSDNQLEDFDSLELGTIDLGQMLADDVLTFPIKLPEGITNETGVAEATVDVQFPDLATKTLTVKNIQAINVPEGLEVDLITQLLEITIRGPKKSVEMVTEEDITVTVDFSNEQIGTATVKAQITIGVDGVGAVHTYNVTATLKTSQ